MGGEVAVLGGVVAAGRLSELSQRHRSHPDAKRRCQVVGTAGSSGALTCALAGVRR
jgi:hypothetical protein